MHAMSRKAFYHIGIVLLAFSLNYFCPASAQTSVKLWKRIKGGCPKVTLTSFLPAESNHSRTAIIVCPGGSYCWLDHQNERATVGRWLQREGVAAFVLKYRTAGIPAFVTHYRLLAPRHQHPNMIQDIQRAIQWVRSHAAEYGIDPHKIGVMGFSAGGHLAMMSGEFAQTNFLSPLGITPSVSLSPDFIAAIYPVVTFSDKRFVHKRSRRGLLGEWKKSSSLMQDSLSVEKHVTSTLPPVFLMNCVDDPIVKYQNSELLDAALTRSGVPHLYKQYKTGGHGFGSNPSASTDASGWKDLFVNWLKNMGF
jgi:acetyl esterase/lipase